MDHLEQEQPAGGDIEDRSGTGRSEAQQPIGSPPGYAERPSSPPLAGLSMSIFTGERPWSVPVARALFPPELLPELLRHRSCSRTKTPPRQTFAPVGWSGGRGFVQAVVPSGLPGGGVCHVGVRRVPSSVACSPLVVSPRVTRSTGTGIGRPGEIAVVRARGVAVRLVGVGDEQQLTMPGRWSGLVNVLAYVPDARRRPSAPNCSRPARSTISCHMQQKLQTRAAATRAPPLATHRISPFVIVIDPEAT